MYHSLGVAEQESRWSSVTAFFPFWNSLLFYSGYRSTIVVRACLTAPYAFFGGLCGVLYFWGVSCVIPEMKTPIRAGLTLLWCVLCRSVCVWICECLCPFPRRTSCRREHNQSFFHAAVLGRLGYRVEGALSSG